MSALSSPSQKNAELLPVIDQRLRPSCPSSNTTGSAMVNAKEEVEMNDKPLTNESHHKNPNVLEVSLANAEAKKDSSALNVPNDDLSGGSITKTKLDDDSETKKMQESVAPKLVKAPSNDLVSDHSTKPVTTTTSEEQGHKTDTTETAVRTPVSKGDFQEIPSSADSSHDNMTLAEMKILVNTFGPHRVPRATMPTTFPTNRSLAQALNASVRDMENIDPQGSGGAVTTASGIASTTLNRCLPAASQCSGSVEEADKIVLPPFADLVNFPQYYGERAILNKKSCVMCGQSRVVYKKRKESDGKTPFILSGNKGVCSYCEMAAWTLTEGNIPIKLCQQCGHFRPLALFASKVAHKDQSLVGSCVHCRDRKKERAKKRKLEKALRLQEKSIANAPGVTVPDLATKDAAVLGKRTTVEEGSISHESSSKRVKLVTPVEVDKDVEMKIASTETTSSSSSSSPSLSLGTDPSSKDSVSSKSPPAPVQHKLMNNLSTSKATSTANVSNEVQVVDRNEKGVETPKATPSVESIDLATPASEGVTPPTRNRCIPLTSCNVSDSGPRPSSTIIPAFPRLVNFSQHSPPKHGCKVCVMCGLSRLVQKRSENDGTTPFVPFGNKGVCSECEVSPWIVVKTKAEIKWCQQGVHFRPLAAFSKEGSSCSACRELASSYK